MKATAKEFALKQIAPYYHNSRLCGYDSGQCLYRTDAGQMCVVGMNMLPDVLDRYAQTQVEISEILSVYDQEDIFRSDVVGILTDHEWRALQSVHDAISEHKMGVLHNALTDLGLFTLDELNQYVQDALQRKVARRRMIRKASNRRNRVRDTRKQIEFHLKD